MKYAIPTALALLVLWMALPPLSGAAPVSPMRATFTPRPYETPVPFSTPGPMPTEDAYPPPDGGYPAPSSSGSHHAHPTPAPLRRDATCNVLACQWLSK